MPAFSQRILSFRPNVIASVAGTMLLLAGCAAAPVAPSASLNDAKGAIQAAEQADASRYAGAELDQARQKLILADKAVVAEEMVLAERFAQESIVTAQLAAARAEATKARAINEDMSRGAKALLEEMQRSGESQ